MVIPETAEPARCRRHAPPGSEAGDLSRSTRASEARTAVADLRQALSAPRLEQPAHLSVVDRTVGGMAEEVTIHGQARRGLHRQLTTRDVVIGALIVAGLGVGMLYLGGRDDLWVGKAGLQTLVTNLGGLLVVSVAAAGLWSLFGKRAFAAEVHAIARTSTDIQQAGIIRVGMNYREDPDWEALFATVRKLDVSVAYGSTWRNLQLDRLRRLAGLSDARIRVFLPDPEDDATINRLADRFGYQPGKLRAEIEEAGKFFNDLRVPGGASIEVYHRPGHWLFSCYRFDQTAVVTLYSHQRLRVSVPTIVVRDGGSFYDFIRKELEAIKDQSHPAPLPDSNDSPASASARSRAAGGSP